MSSPGGLPPSRFGAGYTAGPVPGTVAQPQAVAAPTYSAAPPAVANSGSSNPISAVASPQPSNALATVSLVAVVLFGFFVVPATIPMGLAARSQIRRRGQSGAGVANAALAVSTVYLLIGITALGLWFLIPADVL